MAASRRRRALIVEDEYLIAHDLETTLQPVVFVTSYNDDDTVERIRQQVPGAPVLPKPVYPERLADAIAEASKCLAA